MTSSGLEVSNYGQNGSCKSYFPTVKLFPVILCGLPAKMKTDLPLEAIGFLGGLTKIGKEHPLESDFIAIILATLRYTLPSILDADFGCNRPCLIEYVNGACRRTNTSSNGRMRVV